MPIYPVILNVPSCARGMDHKCRYYYTRLIARKSAVISSEKNGTFLMKMSKNNLGVPLDYNGVYWSITHKFRYVAGIATTNPVGIDIEEILPRSCSLLHNKIAGPHEWDMGRDDPNLLFFRFWTAKEAVLKAEKTGLLGLSKCFVEKIIGKTGMIVSYNLNRWYVEHFYFSNHVVAIATDINNIRRIEWILLRR